MTSRQIQTRGLFVTGTDTGVGKTYVCAMVARELRAAGKTVGAYKPACSGAECHPDGSPFWSDVAELSRAVGGDWSDERISPLRFLAPLAPPVAAALEQRKVDELLLRQGANWWTGKVEFLLIEGAGGLLCPLTDCESFADLAADLGYPLLIIARLGLGTINHTLLTLEAARSRRLAVAGVILNQGDADLPELEAATNPVELARRCDVPILGVLKRGERRLQRDGETLAIDWLSLASESAATQSYN